MYVHKKKIYKKSHYFLTSVGDKPQSPDEKPHQHHKPHALRGLERGRLCSMTTIPNCIPHHKSLKLFYCYEKNIILWTKVGIKLINTIP